MSVFVKGGGSLPKTDFKNGVNVAYESSAQTGSVTVTAAKTTQLIIIFTRSNRNTSDNIRWTVTGGGSTLFDFTASTGRMATDQRYIKLGKGATITITANAESGYAGARCFIVAVGEDSIS